MAKGYPISTNKKWLEGRSMKIKSGYCGNGFCEGTKPRNHNDQPLRTCHLFLDCPCSCHEGLDKMYEIAGLARELVTNPEYVRPKSQFVMPDYEEVAREKAERLRAEGKQVYSDATPDELLAGSVFNQTESGMRAKGQLELQVFAACANLCWPSEMTTITPMTPKFIGEYIARHEGIDIPSSGAIQAAWDRWYKYGLIEEYGRKPVRFLGFKDFDQRPNVLDLEKARDKYKRDTRLSTNEAKRTLIRGARR